MQYHSAVAWMFGQAFGAALGGAGAGYFYVAIILTVRRLLVKLICPFFYWTSKQS
jgi:hypothetical protein